MTATTKPKTHYFVVNQLGQSANRKGPFETRDAAIEWAQKNYSNYPYWLLPVESVGDRHGLEADGASVAKG